MLTELVDASSSSWRLGCRVDVAHGGEIPRATEHEAEACQWVRSHMSASTQDACNVRFVAESCRQSASKSLRQITVLDASPC